MPVQVAADRLQPCAAGDMRLLTIQYQPVFFSHDEAFTEDLPELSIFQTKKHRKRAVSPGEREIPRLSGHGPYGYLPCMENQWSAILHPGWLVEKAA